MPEQTRPGLAICLMLVAILGFDVMGILVRILSHRGYGAAELSAYRNIIGVIPSLIVMFWAGQLRLRRETLIIERWKLALARGLLVTVAQLCFYTSLAYLELATISALAQTNAMFVVLIAVVFFNEKVGVWRIGALVAGLAGAVWILRPGSDAFSSAALLPVIAAFCYSASVVSVRAFDASVSSALLYLYSSSAAAAGGVLIVIVATGFTPIASALDVALIIAMALAGGIAVLLLMFAYRIADPSMLAPFSYLGILSAFFFGWLFFDEAPVDTLFPGVVLVVGAGGILIWREDYLGRMSRKKALQNPTL